MYNNSRENNHWYKSHLKGEAESATPKKYNEYTNEFEVIEDAKRTDWFNCTIWTEIEAHRDNSFINIHSCDDKSCHYS